MAKEIVAKLVPFFLAVCIYFKIFVPHSHPSNLAALLKCLPIFTLIVFTIWHSQTQQLKGSHSSYQKYITLGLCCSLLGDYCLIWSKLFVFGMISFAAAHVNYLRAFGFRPFNLPAAVITYICATLGCIYLRPGLEGLMLPGVPLYTFLLATMMWRAISRIQKNSWTWLKVITALGAIMFVFSDLLIAAVRFRDVSIPHTQFIIMVTYYFAQFGLAVSIIDGPTVVQDKDSKLK